MRSVGPTGRSAAALKEKGWRELPWAVSLRRGRVLWATMLAFVGIGCEEPTAAYPSFSIEGVWVGSFEVGMTPVAVTLDAKSQPCRGTMVLERELKTDSISVRLEYNPPVVAVEPCEPIGIFASFVGEIHQFNLIQGHLFVSGVTGKAQVNLHRQDFDEASYP